MLRLIILGLALYALYVLFFRDKTIIIAPKNKNKNKDNYSDYEEIN
jgi:hypothetical protein